ncbi:MAG TPA: hypothetical protein VG347_05355 [Verrucomicrobiae bacterium]|nr:hypothetical protein [Verrucomicrobiae bacterium]
MICLLFAGALNVSAWAQGIFSPIITPPLVLPSVLSSGGAVTNGGILVITATVTSTTTVKGMTWYCGNQIVSPAKSTTVNTPVLNALGISIGTLSTLTVTGVASTNAGSYYLHATNSAGTTISSPAIVVVANLVNVITSTVTNVVSFVSDATGMVSTGFQIRLSGLTGSNVVIQASSDLSTWTPISTNTFVSGLVNFIDTSAKNRSFRYYRTLAQ